MKASTKLFIATFLIVFSISVSVIQFKKSISIEQNCLGYLKQAANANTVEIAKDKLQKAIWYLEANNLTNGYTSIFFKTPNEDIGFWYKNLKVSEYELTKVSNTSTSLEKTNLLMKLRETILDNRDNVIFPTGLSRYPNNTMWLIINIIVIVIVLFMMTLAQIAKK